MKLIKRYGDLVGGLPAVYNGQIDYDFNLNNKMYE